MFADQSFARFTWEEKRGVLDSGIFQKMYEAEKKERSLRGLEPPVLKDLVAESISRFRASEVLCAMAGAAAEDDDEDGDGPAGGPWNNGVAPDSPAPYVPSSPWMPPPAASTRASNGKARKVPQRKDAGKNRTVHSVEGLTKTAAEGTAGGQEETGRGRRGKRQPKRLAENEVDGGRRKRRTLG